MTPVISQGCVSGGSSAEVRHRTQAYARVRRYSQREPTLSGVGPDARRLFSGRADGAGAGLKLSASEWSILRDSNLRLKC